MATPRTFLRTLLDRLMARAVGLPPETTTYTTTPLRIPMRDGARLAADLYRPVLPADTAPSGQLLVHGPYGRGVASSLLDASALAARGYQVLLVSVRGTFGSDGPLDPGRVEAVDAQDVVAWMRAQDWYPGQFATTGASFMGYTQWALLRDPPADCVAANICVAPHDYAAAMWGTGAYRMDRIGWADTVVHQEDPVWWGAKVRRALTRRTRMWPIMEAAPLLPAVEAHFAGAAPWLVRAMTNEDLESEFYAPMKHAIALDKVDIPVLLTTGWYDLFFVQTMIQYARLRDRGCDVELTIGPWTHLNGSGLKTMPEIFDWMEEHVAKKRERKKEFPVRVFVTGANEWRELPSWPPSSTSKTFYMHAGQGLSNIKPEDNIPPSFFTYNPADPTPSVGGPFLSQGGSVNDSALASRPDVLAFTTDPLDHDVEVLGRVSVELAHTSDTPHVDIFLRLSEVGSNGKSYNITEIYKRLDPTREAGPVKMDLPDCGHRFKKGTRIRFIVAGGCFPMYAKNFGTDETFATAVTLKPATHEVFHGQGGFSRIGLPVNTDI